MAPIQKTAFDKLSFSSEFPKLKEVSTNVDELLDIVRIILRHPLNHIEYSIVGNLLTCK